MNTLEGDVEEVSVRDLARYRQIALVLKNNKSWCSNVGRNGLVVEDPICIYGYPKV